MPEQKKYPQAYQHADVGGTPPSHWGNQSNVVGPPDLACTTCNTIGYDINQMRWCRLYGKQFGFDIPANAQLTGLYMGVNHAVTSFAGNYPRTAITMRKPSYGELEYDWGLNPSGTCANSAERECPYNVLNYLPFTVADLNSENFELWVSVTMGAGNSYGISYVDCMYLRAVYSIPAIKTARRKLLGVGR